MRELVWAIVVCLFLSFLCLSHAVHAEISPRILPPPEYDHEYEGDLTIKMVDTIQELKVLCQTGARSNPALLACSQFTEGLPEGHIGADISDTAAASSAAHSLHGAACTARCGATAENQGKPKGVTGRWPRRPFVEGTEQWAA